MRLKKAFSLIEVLIVLVLIGILATYTIPRLDRDTRSEAINHILHMIRYTQNLALHDNRHNRFDSRWQRAFWRFQIYNCKNGSGIFYVIGTDYDYSRGINRSETAIDPSNGKFTFWDTRKACPVDSTDALNNQVSPNIFLSQKYGIQNVTFNRCAPNERRYTARHIGFDHFGRPYKSYTRSYIPNNWGYATQNCTITFSFQDSSIQPFTIVVPNESGYAYLQENPNL